MTANKSTLDDFNIIEFKITITIIYKNIYPIYLLIAQIMTTFSRTPNILILEKYKDPSIVSFKFSPITLLDVI